MMIKLLVKVRLTPCGSMSMDYRVLGLGSFIQVHLLIYAICIYSWLSFHRVWKALPREGCIGSDLEYL